MIDPADTDLRDQVSKGLLAKFTMMILGFAGMIVFARVLGASGFGAFYLLVTLEAFADQPIVGVAQAAKKRLSEDGASEPEIVGVQIGLYLVFVAAMLLIAWIFRAHIAFYAGIDGAWIYFIALIIALPLFQMTSNMLGATAKVGLVTWIDTLRSAFTLPFQVALVLLGYGVLGMTAGLAAATLFTVPVAFYYLHIRPEIPDRDTLKSVWRYARYSIMTSTMNMSQNKLGLVLIGIGLTPAIAGYYEAALKATMPAVFVAGIAGNGLLAKVSDADSRGADPTDDVRNVMAFGSVLAVPVLFGVATMPRRFIVTAFGEEFAPAALFLVIFGLYRLVQTQTMPLKQTLRGLDRPDIELYFGATSFVITLLGSFIAIHYGYGGIGVAVVLLLVAVFKHALYLIVTRRRLSVPVIPNALYKQLFAGVVMFIVIEAAARVIALPSAPYIAAVVATGAAVYFAVLYAVSPSFGNLVHGVSPV